MPGPESVKNQESEKSPKEIIRAKKEQDEEKQDSTYSIRSTDKVDLEEFDLKSALFRHMNKIKSANRNTANYHLYHALMEALIADEDAMDKEVADKVKDHKRKHDSDDDEDDDDDEGPSAGSNQGRESEASASKQHPTLTSTRWQITDTRETGVDSSMHRSDPESEHSEHFRGHFKACCENVSAMESHYQCSHSQVTRAKIALSLFQAQSASRYLDFGFEEFRFHRCGLSVVNANMTSGGLWHSLMVGRRKEFYINTSTVRSVLSISRKKLNHLPKTDKISLHTVVNMWIRNLVIRNRVGDLQLGIESYQTKINLERPNWDAADYYFKEDYTIVPKPRAVVYRDRNDQRKLMRLNELHMFE
ncbi:hypothetical protein Tco_0534651 [Tanacetum coccineum]